MVRELYRRRVVIIIVRMRHGYLVYSAEDSASFESDVMAIRMDDCTYRYNASTVKL
jgi:copper homeostasis protein CutC